jgi:hypothetical protein
MTKFTYIGVSQRQRTKNEAAKKIEGNRAFISWINSRGAYVLTVVLEVNSKNCPVVPGDCIGGLAKIDSTDTWCVPIVEKRDDRDCKFYLDSNNLTMRSTKSIGKSFPKTKEAMGKGFSRDLTHHYQAIWMDDVFFLKFSHTTKSKQRQLRGER